jgi:glycine cleavage system transcriptional repressor
MMINVPARLPIAQLREDFMEYCDTQNLDAILEPVKN